MTHDCLSEFFEPLGIVQLYAVLVIMINVKKVLQNVFKIMRKLIEAVDLCPDQNLYCLLHRFTIQKVAQCSQI